MKPEFNDFINCLRQYNEIHVFTKPSSSTCQAKEIDEELLTDPEDKRSWDDSGVDVAIQECFVKLLKEFDMERSLSRLDDLGSTNSANDCCEGSVKTTLSLSKDAVAHEALPQIHTIHGQVEETYKQLLQLYKDTQKELFDTEQELTQTLAQLQSSIVK